MRIKGVPQGLASAVEKFYNGKELGTALDPQVLPEVYERQHPSGPVNGAGSTGIWKGRPIAVVTAGADVTLAVNKNGWTIVGGWWPSLGLADPVLGGVRRILAIGGDAREDVAPGSAPHAVAAGSLVEKSRADSLHIVAFDGTGGAGIVGLARDSYAQLSTGGPKQKINGAMPVGGPKAQQETVSNFTGVSLEGYVLTGFHGFMAMIEKFGPLRIAVREPIQILPYRTARDIPSGQLELDPMQALDLARARYDVEGGDLGRSKNQGRIMLAAAAMAKALGPLALPRFMSSAAPHLQTNLTPREMLTFLAHIYTLRPKRVPNKVAGGPSSKVDGRFVIMVDDQGRQLFEDIKDGNLTP